MKPWLSHPDRLPLLSIQDKAERHLLPDELSIEEIGTLLYENKVDRHNFYYDVTNACQTGQIKYSGNIDSERVYYEKWAATYRKEKFPDHHYELLDYPEKEKIDSSCLQAYCEIVDRDFFDIYKVMSPATCLIHRDDLVEYLKTKELWPVEGCLLANWWLGLHVKAVDSQFETTKEQQSIKKAEVKPVFAGFSNLRSNEISLVVLNDHNAKFVIRRKTFTVSSAQLGLKANSQGWELLESAALSSGDLWQGLKRFNTSSDLEKENAKIKTIVSRLRKKLVKAMGLIDDPIPYQPNGSWKFAFKLMTHELLSGSNATKGCDAMDYVTTEYDDNQNKSSFWSENED